MREEGLTRRAVLRGAAYGAGSVALASGTGTGALGAMARGRDGALPTPARIRRDVQRMVDFGPRLTGSDAHSRFVRWLERGFTDAGCVLEPCDVYETSRWEVGRFGLNVLEGGGAGPARVATYFPRSKATPAHGVTGPLVYGGTPPQPSFNGTDLGALRAGLQKYPSQLASWAKALPGTLGGSTAGSILLVDLPAPVPATAGIFSPLLEYYNGQGESEAELATSDYKRLWLHPGLAMPLEEFAGLGVSGVVFILDASYAALKGQYIPFEWQNEDVPALYVDRDAGAKLRAQAASRPKARLTLTATRKTVPTPNVTAILPGRSDETIIFNTHSDGQGFVEENGGVGFVHLARHFASLRGRRRLRRTLVFAVWPGHMSNDLPQAQGWIDTHKHFVDRAAAALTVEHLGCTEWNDTADRGYHATGRAEVFAIWTTAGKMFDLTKRAVVKHDLPRTALLRPPAQFGVGGPFFQAGVPEIGAIAGPEYLLTISRNGEMDKFDARLAAKQVAALADLATWLDSVSAKELRDGDPTLGSPAPKGNIEASDKVPKHADCAPDDEFVVAAGGGRTLTVHWNGRRHGRREVVLGLHAAGGSIRGVSIELRHRGRRIARSRRVSVGEHGRRLVLNRHHRHRFPGGRYTVIVRENGRRIGSRTLHA